MDPAAGTGTRSGAGEVPMAAAPGAVVVLVAVAAAPAPPAGAAAAARPALNWRINLRRRAGEVPMAAAAAPRAVVVVRVAVAAAPPAGAAAAARTALNWRDLRRRWAQTLLILGCAAAALAFFSINSSPTPADFRRLLGACPPTDAEAAALRAASELLLVFAAAQVLGAMTALLVPARRVAIFLSVVGWHTGHHAARVLRMLFECHGRLDAALVIYYGILEAVVLVEYLVGSDVVRSAY